MESRAAHTHPKNTQVLPPQAFTGTAKPYCSICSSPYHQSDDCPHQEPSKKPRRSALVCFDFNKPSGCQRRTCHSPTIATAVDPAVTHSSIAPAPNSMPQAPNQQPQAIAAKNKVEQRQQKQRPTVSTPLDVDKLALELVNHPIDLLLIT